MVYKFIKIRGQRSNDIGFFAPRMYKLVFSYNVLRAFGLWYLKERLTGWTIWWVDNEVDFKIAIKTLNKLKKIYKFEYMVSE